VMFRRTVVGFGRRVVGSLSGGCVSIRIKCRNVIGNVRTAVVRLRCADIEDFLSDGLVFTIVLAISVCRYCVVGIITELVRLPSEVCDLSQGTVVRRRVFRRKEFGRKDVEGLIENRVQG
jgi:hypothetical protein